MNKSSSPIPRSDMNISKVGQASAAEVEIANAGRRGSGRTRR